VRRIPIPAMLVLVCVSKAFGQYAYVSTSLSYDDTTVYASTYAEVDYYTAGYYYLELWSELDQGCYYSCNDQTEAVAYGWTYGYSGSAWWSGSAPVNNTWYTVWAEPFLVTYYDTLIGCEYYWDDVYGYSLLSGDGGEGGNPSIYEGAPGTYEYTVTNVIPLYAAWQAVFAQACPNPASEISQASSWCGSCRGGIFVVNLLDAGGAAPPNGKYQGRIVSEVLSNEQDNCYFNGSTQAQIVNPPAPGPPWTVTSINGYGGDDIGDDPAWIQYYQSAIASGAAPYSNNGMGSCSEGNTQTMSIQACQGTAMTIYNSHPTQVIVYANQVTAVRSNASISGN
jgi:hypothetical protein